MVFDSIHTFYCFAYTRYPTAIHFEKLHLARDCYLSGYHSFKFCLASTFHYMMNHAVLDAEIDHTAYYTLQEGVEHINHEIKEDSQVTFDAVHTSVIESCSQHLINQQQLHLQLLKYNCVPEEFCLYNDLEPTELLYISKPRYTNNLK